MKTYEFIEHTADIGIRVKGGSLEDLFRNAALAMFEIAAGKVKAGAAEKKDVEVEQDAGNIEELFINWLNELLSLSAVKGLIFCDFKIEELSANRIKAVAGGEDIENYKINTEIKAATYHELKIRQVESTWQAEVIFDV